MEEDERDDVVEYDLHSWTGEQVHLLNEQLELAHIAHEWHDDALQVPGRYEPQVDDLVDAIDEMQPLEGEARVDAEVTAIDPSFSTEPV